MNLHTISVSVRRGGVVLTAPALLRIRSLEAMMFQGKLEAIFLGERKGEALRLVETAEAVPGQGLVGDRYFSQAGTFSKKGSPDREVTLIEIEAVEALRREQELALDPGQARRLLVCWTMDEKKLRQAGFIVQSVEDEGKELPGCTHKLSFPSSAGIKDTPIAVICLSTILKTA